MHLQSVGSNSINILIVGQLMLSMGLLHSMKERIRAAFMHLLGSLAVAVVVALLVFGVWYPGQFRHMSGGTELLLLIMTVDVIMGPLLTFVIFNVAKGVGHLRRDLVVIVALQLMALAYGIFTVSMARPVALIFEFDRFRIVSRADVVMSELPEALPEFRDLSFRGPVQMALRRSAVGDERSNALAVAIFEGVDTSQRPKFWVPYGEERRKEAVAAARTLAALGKQYPEGVREIEDFALQSNVDAGDLRFLPVIARKDAVVVINQAGDVLGFLPYDGFF